MLDYEMYGLRAGGYHVTNVLFHILNTLILYWVLFRMTGASWRSGFVAGLFALHPLHVESVAWVAERKDVLSGFFWMLVMLGYVRYVERPGVWRYMWVVVLFMLGLMSKPMLVTLPFVLLLLDVWPLGRYRWGGGGARTSAVRLIGEKIPLFALAAAMSVWTYLAARQIGAVMSPDRLVLDVRLANSLCSYVGYIKKMIWPSKLAVYYPYPSTWSVIALVGCAAFLILVSVAVVRYGRRYPYLLVGWLWYMGSLVPVIGIVQPGTQAMADRYTYIPLIGLFILGGWGAADLFGRRHREAYLASAAAVIIAMGLVSWAQVQHWKDSVSLFEHTVRVTENNSSTHYNLGNVYARKGDFAKAMSHYRQALSINPRYADVHNSMGVILFQSGKKGEAIAEYQTALRLKPSYADAFFNLGVALAAEGKIDQAMICYRRALELKPQLAAVHNNLGILLARQHRLREAIPHFRAALAINPHDASIRNNLDVALRKESETQTGRDH
jgi:tetratricopeptide (TPR) repeat protein